MAGDNSLDDSAGDGAPAGDSRGDGRFTPERARQAALASVERRRREREAFQRASNDARVLPNHNEILETIRAGLPQLRAIVTDPASKPSEVMDALRLLGQWAGLTRQSERSAGSESPESRLAAAYRARGVTVPEHLRPYDKP